MTALKKWWCRLAHSRGRKAFALPTPCKGGQKFLVRCNQCGNVYAVVTPAGWTSPWRSKVEIQHSDREDPVQQYQGDWYFWNGQSAMREGPFGTEGEAREAYRRFCVEMARKTSSSARPRARH